MARQKKRKKRSPNHSPKYEGTPAEPIYEPPLVLGLLGDERLAKAQAQQRARLRIISKYPELFKWYRINPNSSQRWLQLAFRLAVAHVPGMQIRDKPKGSTGPPPKWTWLGPLLVQAVNAEFEAAERAGRTMTLEEATNRIKEDPKQKWSPAPQSLATRYREAIREQEGQTRRINKMKDDLKSLLAEYLKLEELEAPPRTDRVK
jgi:hypothetical protein